MILDSGIDPKGYDMGVDLKIQVVDIWDDPAETNFSP